jgi:hypothetical protein
MRDDGLTLEDRYRRVLRMLPGYYRDRWEQDMVAAFLDSRVTGDEGEDEYAFEFGRPGWAEVASVAGLAARLYLGGAGAPRRYFAWGQAVRGAVLAVALVHASQGLGDLTVLAWRRHQGAWLPASLAAPALNGAWPVVANAVDSAWIIAFTALVLGHRRTARTIAVLAVTADLVFLLQAQVAGLLPRPSGTWSSFILFGLAPVVAMAAFHRDAPPTAPRPWLLALPGYYLLVPVPVMALQAAGQQAWLPDSAGLGCLVVSLACLAHAPRALSRSRRAAGAAGPGTWSLALTLLAAAAGAWRVITLGSYVHDPHLVKVSLAELLILAAAVALVIPDAARAQAPVPAPPAQPYPG